MAKLVLKPRVRETSQTTGTGDYTLLGAPSGYRPFADIGDGDYTFCHVTDGTNWEEGFYTYRSATNKLERTVITGSSNGGAAVNWGVGTRTLRVGPLSAGDYPRQLAKSLAGSGTMVLTVDEQRRDVLYFDGALTGNRTVEVDVSVWTWIVWNNTSGAFSVSLKTPAGTAITIPQGSRCVVCCDGTNVLLVTSAPAGNGYPFAPGTALVFQQTAAPTGWTKATTHNDKALRVVTGTAGSGGAAAFTSVFGAGKVTGGKTLAIADIPSHNHAPPAGVNFITDVGGAASAGTIVGTSGGSTTANTGGGGSHDHTLSLDLFYVDVIIATKD